MTRASDSAASAAGRPSAGAPSPVPATYAGDPLGEDPVDHRGILSSSASVSGVRAAITGALGLGVERRAERVVAARGS